LYKLLNVHLRSFFNSKKYLSSKVEGQSLKSRVLPKNDRYYAVIYGANNRAGKAYAFYLLEKGFNLILIESDISSHRGDCPLVDLQGDLLAQAAENKFVPDIQVIKLQKFDVESVHNSLAHVLECKIKIFVNCINTKRASKSKKNAQDSD
jgi:short-subunit dehydrogenase